MQKALSELERTGLVYAQRTTGRFITENLELLLQLKTGLARDITTDYLEHMEKLGFSTKETILLITEASKEENK